MTETGEVRLGRRYMRTMFRICYVACQDIDGEEII